MVWKSNQAYFILNFILPQIFTRRYKSFRSNYPRPNFLAWSLRLTYFTVKMSQFLRLTATLFAILRLTVNPIETLYQTEACHLGDMLLYQNIKRRKWKQRTKARESCAREWGSTISHYSWWIASRKELEQKKEKSDCELLEAQRSLEQQKLAR